ncbi:hypothetical protein [Methanobrevibacter arboriphilus]|uniref:hypothetical protein n=1 Tax=Methanobrevibacter arboriphilus TaxID=39441 RepID=UPI0029812B4C|nr:hypothetical protein [Methanobrevibacter arboriphilus]
MNDAPALSQANVGVALGSGTDIAMESGDIVLMEGNLENVVAAIQFSNKVMTRIKENIFWAFAYNIILIPVAAGVLYPFFGILFRPELAGLAMALSSVTVISLSLMLRNYIPPIKKIIVYILEIILKTKNSSIILKKLKIISKIIVSGILIKINNRILIKNYHWNINKNK